MITEQKQKLVTAANALLGRPYIYGAKPEDAPNSFDCSSFVQYVFKQIGIDLPRSSILQAADSTGVEITPTSDYSNLEPGDLLFMRGTQGHYRDDLFPERKVYVGHVVIYIGDGNCIHAGSKDRGVIKKSLQEFLELPGYSIVLVKRFN